MMYHPFDTIKLLFSKCHTSHHSAPSEIRARGDLKADWRMMQAARLAARYTSSRRETSSDPAAPAPVTSETGEAMSGSIPAHGMKVTLASQGDFPLSSGFTGSTSLYLAQQLSSGGDRRERGRATLYKDGSRSDGYPCSAVIIFIPFRFIY